MVKKSEKIKKELFDAIEEASWVAEAGDAHDLKDAVGKAHASMADALAYIQQLEVENERLLNSYDAALCETADMHSISKAAEAQVPRWISVEERLPEDMVDILLYGEGRYGMGVRSNGWWCCEDMDGTHITHWMPLPEPPEEDK